MWVPASTLQVGKGDRSLGRPSAQQPLRQRPQAIPSHGMTEKSPDSKLSVPALDNDKRRSMELEERPLPEGWIRQFDATSQHHYYVDTRTSPPRSIWNHPLEDDEYLDSHSHHDSDSESGDDEAPPRYDDMKKTPAAVSPPVGGPSNSSYSNDRALASGSGMNMNYQQGPTPRRRGLVGMLIDAVAGPPSQPNPAMQQRYMDRRQMFSQNQGAVPPQMAGPMYPAGMAMYAPPPTPFMGRHARRDNRRNQRAVRRAVRRGYPVPVGFGGQPGIY